MRDLLGYELDLEAESRRVFPRIAIVRNSSETTYYWNGGDEHPIRVITFIQEPMDMSKIDDFKLSISVSYR